MNLTIANLKEILFKTVGADLLAEGFIYSKSSFEFRKKIGKNIVLCRFDFYDYKPSWIKYNLRLEFTIDEIRKEILKFKRHSGLDFFTLAKAFNEGDFHPETRGKEAKFRVAYAHKIYDFEKNMDEIEWTRQLLKTELFPLIETYTDLQKFQEKHLSDINGAENHGPISSLIFAAKLKDKDTFNKLMKYLSKFWDIENLNDSHLTKQNYIKIIQYAEANS